MPSLLTAVQILISLLLILAVLLQGRGSGLSSPLGGMGKTFHTRCGLEKILYYLTVFLAILFTISILVGTLD